MTPILLVESGSRSIMEAAIPRLRRVFGDEAAFHLITCYSGVPSTLDPEAPAWRTQNHSSPADRARLVRELKAAGVTVIAILCSDESIMTRWKWWLAWKLSAKVLIVNENADCFWLDTKHLGIVRRFLFTRMGLSGDVAARTLARLAVFPFVLVYLLLYASIVHARRAFRNI